VKLENFKKLSKHNLETRKFDTSESKDSKDRDEAFVATPGKGAGGPLPVPAIKMVEI